MVAIKPQLCGQCGLCAGVCPTLALTLHGWGLEVDNGKCTGCGQCVTVCPTGSLQLTAKSDKQNTTTP